MSLNQRDRKTLIIAFIRYWGMSELFWASVACPSLAYVVRSKKGTRESCEMVTALILYLCRLLLDLLVY